MNLPDKINSDFYCSALSLQAGEELFGTASRAGVYLLLEYNGAWGTKAFEESDLPEAVRNRLKAYLNAIPAAKILLIRSRPGVREPGITYFIVSVTESSPVLYEFQLNDYQDLLDLDPQAILSGEDHRKQRRDGPLFLVCTNGKRDLCCAKFGLPVYTALVKAGEASVWQCTHVGGHRFAANALCLPHGILYGRLKPEDAGQILETYRRGELDLEHYRGRVCYSEIVQAADYYLRRVCGSLDLNGFRWLDSTEIEPERWVVRFQAVETGNTHQLQLVVEHSSVKIYTSCTPDKLSSPINYRLVDYKA